MSLHDQHMPLGVNTVAPVASYSDAPQAYATVRLLLLSLLSASDSDSIFETWSNNLSMGPTCECCHSRVYCWVSSNRFLILRDSLRGSESAFPLFAEWDVCRRCTWLGSARIVSQLCLFSGLKNDDYFMKEAFSGLFLLPWLWIGQIALSQHATCSCCF